MSIADSPVLPRVLSTAEEIRSSVLLAQQLGQTVGFVPTMGALHEGHLSLVDAATAACDLTVVSVFVNPTQFGEGEDFHDYPRDLQADLELLKQRDCDLVFCPAVEEVYPPGHQTVVDVGGVARPFEGEFRPQHFPGVATVVLKLLNMVPAQHAYFGQKDYQQTLVVKQLVRDLNVPVEIEVCPIVREKDGLAMSSRNAYLSPTERSQATVLYESLQLADRLVDSGEAQVSTLRSKMVQLARDRGVEFQYVAFVAEGTVEPVAEVTGPTVVAVAAKIGSTRLIDNYVLGAGQ